MKEQVEKSTLRKYVASEICYLPKTKHVKKYGYFNNCVIFLNGDYLLKQKIKGVNQLCTYKQTKVTGSLLSKANKLPSKYAQNIKVG